MPQNIYNPGLHHVGSYQVSGHPLAITGSLTASGVQSVDFTRVTKQVLILNTHGSADLYVYFHGASTDANKVKIEAGEQYTFNVKCNKIYLSGSAAVDYSLYASLTNILSRYMFEPWMLAGPGVTE